MPKISSALKRTTTEFPSIEGSEVVIEDGLRAGDYTRASKSKDEGEAAIMLIALETMIVDWNLEDDNGVKLPVTVENLQKINIFDLQHVFNGTSFAKQMIELQKKMNS